MFATRRTELGKEHIRPIQVGGEWLYMNIPPRGGANRRCDCDGYRPDTLGGGVGQADFDKSTELPLERISSVRIFTQG